MKPIQAVILLLLVLAVARSWASTAPYPRVWSYRSNGGLGGPLIAGRNLRNDADTAAVRDRARWTLNTLDLAPWTNLRGTSRGDVVKLLRSFNPNTIVLGYVVTQYWWLEPSARPQPRDSTLWRDWFDTLKLFDKNPPSAWLYNVGSEHSHFPYNVNWGNHALADSLGTMLARVATMGVYDGIFLDVWDPAPSWAGLGNAPPFDLARAGYASSAAMDSAFRQELNGVCAKIRAAAPPGFKIYVNTTRADSAQLATWGADGQLREGFNTSLLSFTAAREFVSQSFPDVKLLKGEASQRAYSSTEMRTARYLLGTACLGDGWGWYGPDRSVSGPSWGWYDEYSVNEVGASDTTGKHVGWLGQPRGPARVTGGLWVREFDHGMVLVDSAYVNQGIDLGSSDYRSIQGVTDTTVNNGRPKRLVTVPAQDAVFLWRPGSGGDAH